MPIHHVLPGTITVDTTWFTRQSEFEQREIVRLVAFKKRIHPSLADGHLSKHPDHFYPHILPDGCEKLAFYPLIADAVLSYLKAEQIALHTEALNLKSSQVACINFLFPLKQNLSLASAVFKQLIPELDTVASIEFEYTGPKEATDWLGEPHSGMRGQNRTSIDAAVILLDREGRKCATLIEWKYTEHNFGTCGAYAHGSTETQGKCKSLNIGENPDPARLCFLTSGKRHCSRRYWEHMTTAGISLAAFHELKGCPFQGPFYQLMRQYMLAAYLREVERYARVDVVSIGFSGNEALHAIPTHLKPIQRPGQNILDIWNNALPASRQMAHINVEDLMTAVDGTGMVDPLWREYLVNRYGV